MATTKKKSKKKKQSVHIEAKDIEQVLDWKVFFNKKSKLPCGQGFTVVVSAPDEDLPTYVNKPMQVEERLAVMVILKKKPEKK